MLIEYQPSCDGISRIGRYTHEVSQVSLCFSSYKIPIVRKINVEAIYVKYCDMNLYVVTDTEIRIYPLSEMNFEKHVNDGDDTPEFLLPKLDLNFISHLHGLDDLDLRQYQIYISGGYFVVTNCSSKFLIMEFDNSTINKYQQEITVPFSKIYRVLKNGVFILEHHSEYLIYSMYKCVNLGKIQPQINFSNTKFTVNNHVWEIDDDETLGCKWVSSTIYHPRWYSNELVWDQGRVYDLLGNYLYDRNFSIDATEDGILEADGTILANADAKKVVTPVVDYIRLLQPRVEIECLKRAYSQRLMLVTAPEELENYRDLEISEYIVNIAMSIPNLDFSYYIDHTTFRDYLDTEYKIYQECEYNSQSIYNITNLKRKAIDLTFDIYETLDILLYTTLMQDYPRCIVSDCSYTLNDYFRDYPDSWYGKILKGKYSEVSFILLQKLSQEFSDFNKLKELYSPCVQAYYSYYFDELLENHPLDYEDNVYKVNFFIHYTIKVWKYLMILDTLYKQMKQAENPIICLLTYQAKMFVSSYFRNNGYYSIYKYDGVGFDSPSYNLDDNATLAYDFFV